MATRSQVADAVDIPFARASVAGKQWRARGDYAIAATYEPRGRRLRIELASGIGFLIPVERLQGLAGAASGTIKALELRGAGYSLHWPQLDLDISVPDLIAGSLGNRAWMSSLGRQGGKTKSEAKAAAARRNGRKGGRPSKPGKIRHPHPTLV